MQKSIIVRDDESELNRMLSDGWVVVMGFGMPSSCAVSADGFGYNTVEKIEMPPVCLVILEKP